MNRTARQVMMAAGLVALLVVLARMGVLGNTARALVLNVSIPAVDMLGAPWRVLGSGWTSFAGNRAIMRENEELRSHVDDLERTLQSYKELQAKCNQLENLVQLRQHYPELVPARVVLKDDLGWSKSLVIDRGTRDGLTVNMAVVSGGGLVGKVVATGYAYARVLLVIDKSFKAGARLRTSRCIGLVEGGGAEEIVLNYLPRDATVIEGEEVITSGQGGVFPPGYLIGSIKQAKFEEFSFYQYTTVKPAVYFSTLETVAVIKQLPPDIDVPDAADAMFER